MERKGNSVRFDLLGPVRVTSGADTVAVPAGIPQTLLVVLLLNANRVVPSEQLASVVWGDRPPRAAAAGLRNHMMRLRRQLGAEAGSRVRTVMPGYLIEVQPTELDKDLFLDGCRLGRQQLHAGDAVAARVSLAAALDLWRAEPLADLPLRLDVAALVQQLHETRLTGWQDRIDADLALGRHQELIPELQAMATEYPMREAVHGQLMLALYRSERQADALEAYRALRGRLVDELGVEPSEPVRNLHTQILGADPALSAPAPAAPGAPAATGVRQAATGGGRNLLPADTGVFIGRGEELDQLLALARRAPVDDGTPVGALASIEGMPGIGKSALALRAAHRLGDAFPDGRLFLDLRGHTPGLEPLTGAEALARLLDALEVSPQAVPRDPGQRAACYRDRLTGTRTLIVLDNAAGSAQVRPLLPAVPGCMVIITSRRSLSGLDDVHTLTLGALPGHEATALLYRAAGPGRIPVGHPAVPRLLALCDRMPLAIRIVAARLRNRRALRIETVLEELGHEHGRLARLSGPDRSLEAAFASSYLAMPEAEQRLFRLLGQVPGTDFDVHGAAALADTDRRTAENLLESLLDYNLLTQPTVNRYGFHDLVRLFARARADQGPEPAGEREAALERLLDCYQDTARAADLRLTRRTRSTRTAPPAAGTGRAAVPIPDRGAALDWMRAERANLLAAHDTVDPGSRRAVDLSAALAAFLLLEGPWESAAALHEAAAAAARTQGDLVGEADALCDLARVRLATGDLAGASAPLERALELYRDQPQGTGAANALCDQGRVHHLTGRHAEAAAALERSLSLSQSLGDRLGEANALCEQARGVDSMTGDYPAALVRLKRVLALYQDLGDVYGQSIALSELGRIHYLTADFPAAADFLGQALTAFQQLGSGHGQASTLGVLGRVHLQTGDLAGAAARFEQAHAIFRDLGHRHGRANALWGIGLVRYQVGDLAGADARFQGALALFEELGSAHGRASMWHCLGQVRQAAGDYQDAAELLERARTRLGELGDRSGQAQAVISLGELLVRTDGPAAALPLYQQALDIARQVGNRLEEARALEGVGRCRAGLGERDPARAALSQSVELYRRTGAARLGPASEFLAELESEREVLPVTGSGGSGQKERAG